MRLLPWTTWSSCKRAHDGAGLTGPAILFSGETMFKIRYKPSTSHWLFPPIIMGILGILLVVMIVQRALRCRKSGESFLPWKGKRFFIENWDKVRLLGTVVLMVLYILAMEWIGFLAASVFFILLFNVLYDGVGRLKEIPAAARAGTLSSCGAFRSLLVSLAVSVCFSVAIWYLLGQVFKITLP